jgi:membrane protease YdiL (CAAX protease family)
MAAIFLLFEFLGFTLLVSVVSKLGRDSLARLSGGGGGFGLILLDWFLLGLILLIFAWALNRLRRGKGLKELGFRFHKGFLRDIWYGVLGYAVLYIVSIPTDLIALPGRVKMGDEIIKSLGITSIPQILLIGGFFALVAGFVTGSFHEEIRFRGYYQGVGSREVTPLAGFIIALIPFTIGHYFAQPDWSLSQVLATIIPGIVLGLLYNASGSLVAVMTTHTLANWIGFYPPLVYAATKNRTASLIVFFGLAFFFLLLIILRWRKEVREIFIATRQMFSVKPVSSALIGLGIGGALLSLWYFSIPLLYSSLAGAGLIAISIVRRKR